LNVPENFVELLRIDFSARVKRGTWGTNASAGSCALLLQFLRSGLKVSRRVNENEALSKATNPQALEMNFIGILLDKNRRIIS